MLYYIRKSKKVIGGKKDRPGPRCSPDLLVKTTDRSSLLQVCWFDDFHPDKPKYYLLLYSFHEEKEPDLILMCLKFYTRNFFKLNKTAVDLPLLSRRRGRNCLNLIFYTHKQEQKALKMCQEKFYHQVSSGQTLSILRFFLEILL